MDPPEQSCFPSSSSRRVIHFLHRAGADAEAVTGADSHHRSPPPTLLPSHPRLVRDLRSKFMVPPPTFCARFLLHRCARVLVGETYPVPALRNHFRPAPLERPFHLSGRRSAPILFATVLYRAHAGELVSGGRGIRRFHITRPPFGAPNLNTRRIRTAAFARSRCPPLRRLLCGRTRTVLDSP